jgi:hypothetical protein
VYDEGEKVPEFGICSCKYEGEEIGTGIPIGNVLPYDRNRGVVVLVGDELKSVEVEDAM